MPTPPKDLRYAGLRALIEIGHVTRLGELFTQVSRHRFALDLHIGETRFKRLVVQPEKWKDEDVEKMARLLEVSFPDVLKLLQNEARYINGKKKKSPKKGQ